MGIKKVTAFLMAVLMVCGAAGCSDKTTQDSSVNETETDSSSVIAEQDVEQEVSSEVQETTAESEIMSEAEQTSEVPLYQARRKVTVKLMKTAA